MSRFQHRPFFPRAHGQSAWLPLLDLRGTPPEQLLADFDRQSIDLRRADFHPAGERRVDEQGLLDWREDLNVWAQDAGFPSKLATEPQSRWYVDLGTRLLEDTEELPERLHPHVWCWLATNLFPHFVVYRWGWPAEGARSRDSWRRFGDDLRNGLLLAMHRVLVYGPELARRASEQEFQSIQYRPAFGLDQRVARLVLETLVEANDDPLSNYGKNGGTRALDGNSVCIELRIVNSLRPLCFAADDDIVGIIHDAIARLPELRVAAAKGDGVDLPDA